MYVQAYPGTLFCAALTGYPHRPVQEHGCDKKQDEQKNTHVQEEHFASPDSLFWRGIWMLVF